jgi:hypothetical protein
MVEHWFWSIKSVATKLRPARAHWASSCPLRGL